MRRTLTKNGKNTTRKAQLQPEFDVRAEITILKARTARLEARFTAEDQWRRQTTVGPTSSAKRGPKPKHSPDILQIRDLFVRFLEEYWPEIEPFCGPKPNMRGLREIFSSFSGPEFGQVGTTAQWLLERLTYIEQFLTGPRMQKRFRNNPRVLAGAIAGVPGIGIERSLRLCPLESCVIPMQYRALRSYLRRNHPDLYRALLVGLDVPQLIAWLREHRSEDKLLKQYGAVDLKEAWDSGKADYSRMQMNRKPKYNC